LSLAERDEFSNSRQIRAAQGSLLIADQVNGCTFFGSFLYASKEMNIKYNLETTCYFVFCLIIFITNQPANHN